MPPSPFVGWLVGCVSTRVGASRCGTGGGGHGVCEGQGREASSLFACVPQLLQEGKSAEELEALAIAAEERADYFQASHYMYAARVASGDIDTNEKKIGTVSGFANYFRKVSLGMAE